MLGILLRKETCLDHILKLVLNQGWWLEAQIRSVLLKDLHGKGTQGPQYKASLRRAAHLPVLILLPPSLEAVPCWWHVCDIRSHSECLVTQQRGFCLCMQRGWLTTPPGCSSPWRWRRPQAGQGPLGKMARQAGQVLQDHLGSPVR